MAKSNKKLVHVRVKSTSAFKQAQIAEIRNVLAGVGLEYGTISDYSGNPGNGITQCSGQACVGFEPGTGDDPGSRCQTEACDTQACTGHACDNQTCDTEACGGHICDIHEKETGKVMAGMTAKSPTFAALQKALATLPGGAKSGISLSTR